MTEQSDAPNTHPWHASCGLAIARMAGVAPRAGAGDRGRSTSRKGGSMAPCDGGNIAVTFGRRLRAWRRKKNYAIHAVADDLGVSKQIVSEWERGIRFPCQKHLANIARYTDVPLCTFFREGSCQCNPHATCE